ncbi:MAG: hypothetical protein NTW19_07685 [Planctomycetota bacterium]|nr:hypothetical protein [Planctomycetota bacterium]
MTDRSTNAFTLIRTRLAFSMKCSFLAGFAIIFGAHWIDKHVLHGSVLHALIQTNWGGYGILFAYAVALSGEFLVAAVIWRLDHGKPMIRRVLAGAALCLAIYTGAFFTLMRPSVYAHATFGLRL